MTKRKLEMVVENCMSCPAHHCIFKFGDDNQKCVCERMKNRTIPESLMWNEFPKWCPLKKVRK